MQNKTFDNFGKKKFCEKIHQFTCKMYLPLIFPVLVRLNSSLDKKKVFRHRRKDYMTVILK